MGSRGPAPTPTAILEMRGSTLLAGRQGEPRPPVERPACPKWVKGEAKAEWLRQVKELERLNLAARIDRPLLAAYCAAWAEYVELTGQLAQTGRLLKNAEGEFYPNPLVRLRDKAEERVVRIAGQFGFSPSARTRLRVEDQKAEGLGAFARQRGETG